MGAPPAADPLTGGTRVRRGGRRPFQEHRFQHGGDAGLFPLGGGWLVHTHLSHRQEAQVSHPVRGAGRDDRLSPVRRGGAGGRGEQDRRSRRRRGEIRALARNAQALLPGGVAETHVRAPRGMRGLARALYLLRCGRLEQADRDSLPADRLLQRDDGMGPPARGGRALRQGGRSALGRRIVPGAQGDDPGGILEEFPRQVRGEQLDAQENDGRQRETRRSGGRREGARSPLSGPVQLRLLARALRRPIPASSEERDIQPSHRGRE